MGRASLCLAGTISGIVLTWFHMMCIVRAVTLGIVLRGSVRRADHIRYLTCQAPPRGHAGVAEIPSNDARP